MKKSFILNVKEALESGLLLSFLEEEKTLSSVCVRLGYSAHGRNTGALNTFLKTNSIEFKNHTQKTIEFEVRNCVHCGKEFSVSLHDKSKYKVLTCSHSCSGAYPEYIKRRVVNKIGSEAKSYPIVAKRAGLTFCCICGEKEVVDIHHLDEDRTNDSIDNLVALCPTHHAYMHRGKSDLILDKLIAYLDSRNCHDVPGEVS
jgi:hypothetical protein